MTSLQVETTVRVGIADGAVVKRPLRLRTNGLGSCVGVVLYDIHTGICGLVHVMLPQAPVNKENLSQTKFADLGVVWLVNQLMTTGAHRQALRAKIAGGAQMFSGLGGSDLLRIGPRNVEVVEAALKAFDIPLVAKDIGGSQGRTIEFDSVTATLTVRTALGGTVEI